MLVSKRFGCIVFAPALLDAGYLAVNSSRHSLRKIILSVPMSVIMIDWNEPGARTSSWSYYIHILDEITRARVCKRLYKGGGYRFF